MPDWLILLGGFGLVMGLSFVLGVLYSGWRVDREKVIALYRLHSHEQRDRARKAEALLDAALQAGANAESREADAWMEVERLHELRKLDRDPDVQGGGTMP